MLSRRVLLTIGAGLVSFSFSPILVRLAADAPSVVVAAWRTLFAVAFLTPFIFGRAVTEFRSFSRREWSLVVLAGFLLGLHFIAWIDSIYHTTVASASVLFAMNPLFIAILGLWALNERLDRATVMAIFFGIIGAVMITIGDSAADIRPEPSRGNLLALTSAFLFAVYLLIGRVMRRRSTWLAYVYPLYVVVALTVVGYCLAAGSDLFGYDPKIYVLCALMALGPQLVGHGSFNYAVKYMPAAILGVSSLVEPVLAAVWAWLLFDEVPAGLAVLGALVVLTALTMIYTRRAIPRTSRTDANTKSAGG